MGSDLSVDFLGVFLELVVLVRGAGLGPLLHPFSGRPWWRGEEVGVEGVSFLLQVGLVVLFCDGALAGRGGEGSARRR